MDTNMFAKTMVSAAVVVALSTGGLAFAQDHRDRNPRTGETVGAPRSHGESGNEAGMGPPPSGSHGYSRQDRRSGAGQQPDGHRDRGYSGNGQRLDERGAGPDHQFRRGQRLPPEYHNRNYVVDDWRGHHLSAPPRGYHWVQTGNDYVLVAIASGLIAQILLGN